VSSEDNRERMQESSTIPAGYLALRCQVRTVSFRPRIGRTHPPKCVGPKPASSM